MDKYTTSFEGLFDFDFSLVRYGNWDMLETHLLDDGELVRTLSHSGGTILSLPSNLAFALFLASDSRLRNQFSSRRPRNEPSWKISGKTISELHHSKGLSEIFDANRFNGLSLDDLMVDRVEFERFSSDEKWDIYCQFGKQRFKVNPFLITRFYLAPQYQKQWLNFLVENSELVCHTLGIENPLEISEDDGEDEIVF